jgi:hypothetical protein
MAGCSGPADPTYNVNQDGSTQGMLDTMTGAPLASEADGIAWNFTQILAASGAGGGPGTLDPNDPLSVSGCSLMNPAACVAAQAFLSASTRELDDDPSGAPARRWLWESGAEFVVTAASGSLSPFQGWTLHAFGPEESRASGGTIGVPFLLVPPEGVTMPPASPLVVISDGTPTPGDETFQGVAYGVAP